MRRIFDSGSSSWYRGFHEFPVFVYIWLRVGSCYGTAMNDAGRPVMTPGVMLGSYL